MNSPIKLTEEDLREQIKDLCKDFGWRFYYTWTSMHSPRGFPDLVLANPEKKRVVYAELKSESGKLTPDQEDWLKDLADCGCEVYLWRPSDWEEICEVLVKNEQSI